MSLLILMMAGALHAQDLRTIAGQVLNGAGNAVENVSVGVEGSAELPSITDSLGRFKINVQRGTEWLNVAPPGAYESKRIYINKRSDLTIYLSSIDAPSGDRFALVLSNEIRRRDLVPATSALVTDRIKESSTQSIDSYLQGRIPGMHVVNRSGDTWSGAPSLLRGIKSLNATNQALYVVDGITMPSMNVFSSIMEGYFYNPLVNISPLDISSVTIVKDPVILSAYGSKASNGLVLIETLDPSATETTIDIDLRLGYSMKPFHQVQQMNAGQHKTFLSEVLFTSGKAEEEVREEYPNLFLSPDDDRYIDYQHNTNWQDLIYTDALFSMFNINVKGGDGIARYGLAFGYTNADGILKNTGFSGYNLRFVSRVKVFKWLQMDAGVALSYNKALLKESARVPETSPILTSLAKSPLLNPYQYDEDGDEMIVLAPVDEIGISNPMAVIENFSARNTNLNSMLTVGLKATLDMKLSMHTNLGLNNNVLKEALFMPNQGMESYYNEEAINVSKAGNNKLALFYNNTYLLYKEDFGDNHSLTSNTGVHVQSNKYEYDWGISKNAAPNDQYRDLQDGTDPSLRELGGANRTWNWISFYESIRYGFRDTYLASATVSLDGSSRVGSHASDAVSISDQPFGIFYAAGLGWRLSNESFLRNVSWLEELKLRVSYGITGNDDIGELNALPYYQSVRVRESTGVYPAVVLNDQLNYETVSQLNGGLDLSLLGNRFSATVDLYQSNTDRLLVYAPLEPYYGYAYRIENGGEMQNRGVDVGLFLRVVDGSRFKWDLQATYSAVKNEILSITGDKMVTQLAGGEVVNMVGEEANSFYGYVFEGVYATTREAVDGGLINDKGMPYQAGDAIFADLSGPDKVPDGVIDKHDKTVIGTSMPAHFGGIFTSFSYKRWSLNAFFQMIVGNDLYNYVRHQNEQMTGLENQSTRVLNRWQYEGQETDVPRALWNDPVGNAAFSTRWIENGTYFRVKSLTLSYTIPDKFGFLRNAQFYVSAQNLFTYSNYLGYDPEFAYSYTPVDQGVDYGLPPQTRQFMLGIKLGL